MARFNDRLTTLHAALPRNAALIILTGHSSPIRLVELQERRKRWERSVRLTSIEAAEEKWTTEDDRELEAAAVLAREGMAFFCVK